MTTKNDDLTRSARAENASAPQHAPTVQEGFTPGQWTVHGDSTEGSLEIKSGQQTVAYVFGGAVRPSEMARLPSIRRANARLIAAAPDLLEAAKHAAMEWRLHGQLTDSCRVLEAAIAKA
jgi:hypothetical protein